MQIHLHNGSEVTVTTMFMKVIFVYGDIFNKNAFEVKKRNLKDSTINAYCRSVAFFNYTNKLRDKLNW